MEPTCTHKQQNKRGKKGGGGGGEIKNPLYKKLERGPPYNKTQRKKKQQEGAYHSAET